MPMTMKETLKHCTTLVLNRSSVSSSNSRSFLGHVFRDSVINTGMCHQSVSGTPYAGFNVVCP